MTVRPSARVSFKDLPAFTARPDLFAEFGRVVDFFAVDVGDDVFVRHQPCRLGPSGRFTDQDAGRDGKFPGHHARVLDPQAVPSRRAGRGDHGRFILEPVRLPVHVAHLGLDENYIDGPLQPHCDGQAASPPPCERGCEARNRSSYSRSGLSLTLTMTSRGCNLSDPAAGELAITYPTVTPSPGDK